MDRNGLNPGNTIFIMLSFEGPDAYSQAGGLGVRATHLSRTLADAGFATHLFFIGSPQLKGEEVSRARKLILHRWCQWISQYYPLGVYQGESDKVRDFSGSIPPFVFTRIIQPAWKEGKIIVILSEEWQTCEALCGISNLIRNTGHEDNCLLFWNANNTFCFERINWRQLVKAATITTVSRYMKQVMWKIGVNPIVIPNGIPRSLLNPVDCTLSEELRKGLGRDLLLAKIARWDPDKRWNMAIEAIARLNARGRRATLLARGGIEPY
jgi:glycosyltransferase involved in cell wall biosynthesis